MVELLGFLLQLLFEVIGQLVFELIAHLGLEVLKGSPHGDAPPRPALGGIAHMLMGLVAGAISVGIYGSRITPSAPIPGASLVLAPLGTGSIMHGLGEFWGDRRNRPALFTFKGGAAFAFGMAIVRFAWFEWIGR